MDFGRLPFSIVVALIVAFGCAGSEPEVDDEQDADVGPFSDAGTTDDVRDGGDDADETGNGDSCDLCDDGEICDDGECVDPCVEVSAECGDVEYDGDEFECGECSVGECDDGSCPSVCDVFDAECGEVYFDGAEQSCGDCGGFDRCMRHNRCTPGEGYIELTSGYAHTCGFDPQGNLLCWGRNEDGQLGDGNPPDPSATSTPVSDLWEAATVSSLNNHTCVARQDDHIYCWGSNGSDRLKGEPVDDGGVPVDVELTGEFAAAGGEHSCAVTSAGHLVCWGSNSQGQLGRGNTSSESGTPQRVLTDPTSGDELEDVVDVALGSAHSCALDRDNDVWCWGRNHHGQLGHGDTTDGPYHAERVSGLGPVRQITAGFNHTCAVDADGDLWCWGRGDNGQLGQEEPAAVEDEPVVVEELDESIVDVSAGQSHTCAVDVSEQIHCWGRNNDGQLGVDTVGDNADEPETVDGVDDVRRVAAGGNHTCVVAGAGDVYCWGRNDEGQLGDGTFDGRSTPEPVD